MALLHTAETPRRFVRTVEARVNWRLLLALGATLGFWIVVGQTAARLF